MRGASRLVVKLLSVVTVLSIFLVTPSGFDVQAEDSLEEQLKELEAELRKIREKQKALQAEISETQEEQSYLQSQISSYNNSIAQAELIIQATEKQIEVYNKEIELLAQQIENTEKMIEVTNEEIEDKRVTLKEVSFNIYQTNQISTLDLVLSGKSVDESLFWTHYLNLSKEEGQGIIDDLEALHTEQEAAKAELEVKKSESETIREELKIETQALADQIDGLSWQKKERQSLLTKSEEEEDELNAEKAELDKIEREIEQKRSAVEYELLSRVTSGSSVTKGQPIAQIGRTGHVRSSYVPGCPYPHPVTYPKYGSHLHFSMYIGSSRVNPYNYIYDGPFKHPTPGAYITQSYHGEHLALDFAYAGPDATWGKPIYASCAGTVSYHTWPFDADDYGYPCGPFPRDDAHFYKLVCDEPYDGQTVIFYGWHLK